VRTIVLLGPQRLQPTLVQAVETVGVDGPIAAVTAGWEEREDEIDELRQHLGRRVVNLKLYRRTEEAFAVDPEFFEAWHERRGRLREMLDLYRLRLDAMMRALRDLRKRKGREDLLAVERAEAIDDVRRLDAHHLAWIAEEHAEFEARWRPHDRTAIAAHRREILRIARGCGALAIAGGNVAVLLNRLSLFGIGELFDDHTVFAWSAGAMALTERVVLFHDDPPQGRGNPAVLGPGLGAVRGIVALPHAHRRIRLDRPSRLSLWAARFAPASCLAFDDGSATVWRRNRLAAVRGGVRRFTDDGKLEEVAAE